MRFLFLFLSLLASLFADDGNLSNLVPTSLAGQWFWDAAALVVGVVVALKAIQLLIRLIRRA